ncbi:MAG: cytochrome d ubiquinol oxidase subunit II, partial [Ktedonobacterales bacterium]
MIPSAASIHLHVFAYINAFVLWLNIIAFAIFQGSDSGAGIWFLFAREPLKERQRKALATPVKTLWEANETWSVFLVTGIFSAFPVVFYTLVVSFFYPLTLALIALVFFGAAFEFYEHTPHEKPSHNRWMWAFVVSCVAIPLLFGDVAGAVASGAVHYDFRTGRVTSSYWTTWLTPFTICVGLFAVGICMVLAATFQTVQSARAAEAPMLAAFRRRALISGAFTALVGAVAAGLAY